MKMLLNRFWIVCSLVFSLDTMYAQPLTSKGIEIALISDTQEPMDMERMIYRSNQNKTATRHLFEDIYARKPKALFLLGDVVALGYQQKRWERMDVYLDSLRKNNIQVHALLGNHDLMISPAKGEAVFRERFPDMVNTGFVETVDSISFVMLNSNFKQLSARQRSVQDSFYRATLDLLDKDSAVKFIVVCCHHAPYSNSRAVGSNKQVQERFVKPFMRSSKAKLFVTGHSHAFEHFKIEGKDFLTIGGGGGLHHRLNRSASRIASLAENYAPEFHYLLLQRDGSRINLISRRLLPDFSGFEDGYRFTVQ